MELSEYNRLTSQRQFAPKCSSIGPGSRRVKEAINSTENVYNNNDDDDDNVQGEV